MSIPLQSPVCYVTERDPEDPGVATNKVNLVVGWRKPYS